MSFYQLGSGAAALAKDKQRAFAPSVVQNETYGAVLGGGPAPGQPAAPGAASAPPLPPRNVAKGTAPPEPSGPCRRLRLGFGWEGVLCCLGKRRQASVGAAHSAASTWALLCAQVWRPWDTGAGSPWSPAAFFPALSLRVRPSALPLPPSSSGFSPLCLCAAA